MQKPCQVLESIYSLRISRRVSMQTLKYVSLANTDLPDSSLHVCFPWGKRLGCQSEIRKEPNKGRRIVNQPPLLRSFPISGRHVGVRQSALLHGMTIGETTQSFPMVIWVPGISNHPLPVRVSRGLRRPLWCRRGWRPRASAPRRAAFGGLRFREGLGGGCGRVRELGGRRKEQEVR